MNDLHYGEHLDEDGIPMCRSCRINRSRSEDALRQSNKINGDKCPFCKRIRRILARD